MSKHDLPARLDRVIDDVEAGALLKNLETGRLAVLVDVGDQGRLTGAVLTLAVAKDRFYQESDKEEDTVPNGPAHFRLVGIGGEEMMNWLVLSLGQGAIIE